MLFTPNDFNSSSVRAISGVAHSQPQVCAETVMPLINAGGVSFAPGPLQPPRAKKSARMLSSSLGVFARERIFENPPGRARLENYGTIGGKSFSVSPVSIPCRKRL